MPGLSRKFAAVSVAESLCYPAVALRVMMKSLDQRPLSQRVLLTNVVAVGGVLLGFAVSDVKPSARVCVYIAVLIVALMNLMFLVVRPRLFALRAAGATALNPFRTFYEVLKEIRNSGIRIMGQCRERDNNNGVKPVDEYCAVSMSKRLGHGFSTLSGKTAAHLSRYDARAKESLVACSKVSRLPTALELSRLRALATLVALCVQLAQTAASILILISAASFVTARPSVTSSINSFGGADAERPTKF